MSDDQSETTAQRMIGRVKLFNSRRGFGFITGDVFDPVAAQKDYFFHFSSVEPQSDNYYVYLRTNEYVEFELKETDNEDPSKRFVATSITGLNNGPLLMDAPRRLQTSRRTQPDRRPRRGRYDEDYNPTEQRNYSIEDGVGIESS